jgi:hypothetical protein
VKNIYIPERRVGLRLVVNLQVAFDMRYGESSYSHQLQNSLRRSLCNHRFRACGMRKDRRRPRGNASNPYTGISMDDGSKEDDQARSNQQVKACTHTVLASELVDGVDEAVVQIGGPSQPRHLGPVVLPHAAAPLPADHRPHHGHLSASSLQLLHQTGRPARTGYQQLYIWLDSQPLHMHVCAHE